MMKIDKRKKLYILVDVETAGDVKWNPLVYDLGFAIVDSKGKIYEEHSIIIKEIFYNRELMSSAYYSKKIPSYLREIDEGLHKVMSWKNAMILFRTVMEKWEPKKLSAYNLAFDVRAMKNTHKKLGYKGKIITPKFKNIEMICIWALACQTIFLQKGFQKIARNKGWVTNAGNLRTSAEMAYRYMEKDYTFIEEHKGLADVKIEAEILAHCLRQNKKYKKGIISHPWRIPQPWSIPQL